MVLFGRKLEREIRWEALAVASYLLVQLLDRDPIELGEVAVENDPLVAENEYPSFNGYGGLCRAFGMGLEKYTAGFEVAICNLKICRIFCVRSQFVTSNNSHC